MNNLAFKTLKVINETSKWSSLCCVLFIIAHSVIRLYQGNNQYHDYFTSNIISIVYFSPILFGCVYYFNETLNKIGVFFFSIGIFFVIHYYLSFAFDTLNLLILPVSLFSVYSSSKMMKYIKPKLKEYRLSSVQN